jgi:hypothetical protein
MRLTSVKPLAGMNQMSSAKAALRGAIAVAALTVLSASNAVSQTVQTTPNKAAARDVISDEKLRQEFAGAVKINKLMANKSKPLDGNRPSIGNSLYARSIILFDGEKHTVVPVGSVLHLPDDLRGRVVSEATGDFTYWPNFLKRNAAWLAAKEVPLKMAKGDRESSRAVLNGVAREPRLLVAVYKGGPISILEPTTPPPSRGGTNANQP